MFDFAKLDTLGRSEAGVDFIVRHPLSGTPILRDDGKQVTIKVLGRTCEKLRALQRAIQTRNSALAARGITLTDDDLKAQRSEYLVAAVLDWNFDTLDGQPFPYSEANSKKLWADVRWEWLTQRIYAFVLEEGNFLAL